MATKEKTEKKMEKDRVILPNGLTNWEIVKHFLVDIKCSLQQEKMDEQQTGWSLEVVYNTIQSRQLPDESMEQQLEKQMRKQLSSQCVWYGMAAYLNQISAYKKDEFLYVLLPKIIDCAINVEELQEDLLFSRQQRASSQTLSRSSVCSLVACFFLCLFPERFRRRSSNLNIINFKTFFKHLPLPSQVGKLQCILHYFECVLTSVPEGNMEFTRKTLPYDSFLTMEELVLCKKPMSLVIIDTRSNLEDTGSTVIHVDFANKSIGGGVLNKGAVQEEIRFCVCPELLVSMLFMENMEDNEAIVISGFEQFSEYKGYGSSFKFAGSYTRRTTENDVPLALIAIDALSYRGNSPALQYSEEYFIRDFHKALIGFSKVHLSSDAVEDEKLEQGHGKSAQFHPYDRPIATGNWGCGAFRGNAQLKFIMQWLAASIAGYSQLLYFTYQDKRVEEASEIVELLSSQTVGVVAMLVKSYCHWASTNMTSLKKKKNRSWKSWLQQSRSEWQAEVEAALPQSLFHFLRQASGKSIEKARSISSCVRQEQPKTENELLHDGSQLFCAHELMANDQQTHIHEY